MKKRIYFVLSILLILLLPYCVYGEEQEQGETLGMYKRRLVYYDEIRKVEKSMSGPIEDLERTNEFIEELGGEPIEKLSLNDGIRVYIVDEADHYTTAEELFETGPYGWRIPVFHNENGYIDILFAFNNQGGSTIMTSHVDNTDYGNIVYLFEPQTVKEALDNSGLEYDPDSVVPIHIKKLDTDLVYFTAEEQAYAIVYKADNSYLEAENGSIHKFDEIMDKALFLIKDRNTTARLYDRLGWSDPVPFNLYTVIPVVLIIAIVYYIFKKNKARL